MVHLGRGPGGWSWSIGTVLAIIGLVVTIIAIFTPGLAISFTLLVKLLFLLAFLAILL